MEYFKKRLIYNQETGIIHWVEAHKKSLIGRVAGGLASDGYWMIRVKQRNYRAHRIAWLLAHGSWPDGEIDHINGNRLDNRLVNLRCVSRSENSKNVGLTSRNSSGVVGVRWNSIKQRWIAKITSDGVNHHLGTFHDMAEAVSARKEAEVRFGFHENHGRLLPIA